MRLYFSFILFTFSIISFSEPRLGKDFFLLNDPLPVKQDGIVEVTEVLVWLRTLLCNGIKI